MTDDTPVGVLLQAAAHGESGAWETLVDRYARVVWLVCRRFRLDDADAADVSQTVWLRLLEQLTRIREPEALVGWLATTTRHECLRVLRRVERYSYYSSGELDHELSDDPEYANPERRVLDLERAQALREGLALLPQHCRRLLTLLAAEPTPSYEEISTLLGMPTGSIGPTRRRCLDKLRDSPPVAALMAGAGEPTLGVGR